MKKFRKDWETINGFTFEQVVNKVTRIFSRWQSTNLIIEYGKRERITEYTYGLPYVSSGDFALVDCSCNVRAVLRKEKEYAISYIAISEENEIVAIFEDAEENEKYVTIGRL